MTEWDLAVVGAGPAGLSAAYAAARVGARTLVLEKAEHPRYKTCGGGLVGASLTALAGHIEVPVRDQIHRATFTRSGRHAITRQCGGPLLTMVCREEFDDRLRQAAEWAGARLRQRTAVRALDQDPDGVWLRLADGSTLRARTVIGADGSSGVTARYVGVRHDQVDLGLEVELPAPPRERARWRGHVQLDWGPIPGSYAWAFPKRDRLSVGVIAARGQGERTRGYLRWFLTRLGLDGIDPIYDSGHLTRCRTDDSPLRRGRVLVAGDAAGLLEPWTREGISCALRSGALAGASVAAGDPDRYVHAVRDQLMPAMRAGRHLLNAFTRRPAIFHTLLATPVGWRMFTGFCQGRLSFEQALENRAVRAALTLLG